MKKNALYLTIALAITAASSVFAAETSEMVTGKYDSNYRETRAQRKERIRSEKQAMGSDTQKTGGLLRRGQQRRADRQTRRATRRGVSTAAVVE